MNDLQYFLWLNEKQSGPYTITQLKSMWQSGQITSATCYWFDGLTEWLPIESMIEEGLAEDRRNVEMSRVREEEAKKEKPITTSENVAIILASFLASPITFVAGILYCIVGKKNRGVRLMAWSMAWIVVLAMFFGYR